MSDWSHGYNISQGYTYGYFRELSPAWLRAAAMLGGWRAPGDDADPAGPRRFRYLELGSGQGVGLCLLAAAEPEAEFVGIDFNPEHVAHSRELAAAGGLTNVRFLEADFAALGAEWPEALGQFQFVTLHGIYSWVPAPIREALIACLHAAVAPGGLVYLSYNAMPGWASTLPLQHMFRMLDRASAKPGPQVVKGGIALFERLAAANAGVTAALPTLKNRLETLKGQKPAYLVQEYLHENWHPMWASQVAGELASAKLDRIGTATFAESLLPHALRDELREIVLAEPDGPFRADLIDCVINQSFRRDLFCRGPRRRLASAGMPDLTLHRLPAEAGEVLKVETSYGELQVRPELFRPMLERLERAPATLAEIVAGPAFAGEGKVNVAQAVTLLIHAGQLGIGAPSPADSAAAHRINLAIARAAAAGAPYGNVAAPLIGGALAARDIDLIMLDLVAADPGIAQEALGRGLDARLQALGRRLSDGGKPLEGEAGAARAQALAGDLLGAQLDGWRRFGVVAPEFPARR